jgi:hypothetical protein
VDGRTWDRNRKVLGMELESESEMSSAGSARAFYCLDGCARPLTRGCGGGGTLFSAESGYCRPEETRVPGRIRWTRLR